MINNYSLPKVFYEDLYEAFIFHVENSRKVFIYKLFMRNIEKLKFKKAVLKKGICVKKEVVFILQKKMYEVGSKEQNQSRNTSGEGRFYKRCL